MTTELRLVVLRLLHDAARPLSTIEVAQAIGRSRNTTWRLLARLEEDRLVGRTYQTTATGHESVWTTKGHAGRR